MRSRAQNRLTAVGRLVRQVVRRRPARPGGPLDVGVAGRACAEHGPVGGRDADRRRTAHPERTDRLPDRRHVATLDPEELGRQEGLVDQMDDAVGGITRPADGLRDLVNGRLD